MFKRLTKCLLTIDERETQVDYRGFRCSQNNARFRIEQIGKTFVEGYHLALEHAESRSEALGECLCDVFDKELEGFAFEGASMALAVLDCLPWGRSNRFELFIKGPAQCHVYMAYVGLGWAIARCPFQLNRAWNKADPLLRWLIIEGYGFHHGYFHTKASIRKQVRPKRLRGYACRAFDQGLGRCLWFIEGTDVESIAASIASMDPLRHADLWSGVGLAATYAGGVDSKSLYRLQKLAGSFSLDLAQGSAFAAKARLRAGNLTDANEENCRILCSVSAREAAFITDRAMPDKSSGKYSKQPAFDLWREQIKILLKTQTVASERIYA